MVYLFAFFLFVMLCWSFTTRFIWQPDDPLYIILSWVEEYFLLVGGTICLIGWIAITCYFISKPMRYLDAAVEAAGQLAQPTDTPITLPKGMKHEEDELNLARQSALRHLALAKEAEQRKNDLIVYLAHDLKTPLTSVIGYLTLLRDEPDISPALRARYTGIALEKAERLESLIDEFFDITRFSLTTLRLEPERVSLSRMLEQTVSEFAPILSEHNLTWYVDIPPDVELFCDPDKLARVFDNLIRNAVAYSDSGTALELTMLREGDHVRVALQNCGKTIPADKLDHIFEQFFRLDAARSSATGGAGLGLAIAREIVSLHGGSITAQSADGRTRFTVCLPLVCSPQEIRQKIV